jgi:hypothetical protein
MAAPMTAAQMRAALTKWKVPYKEYAGWTTRKRPGAFAPIGVVIHHTGSDGGQNSTSYDKFLFVDGRKEEGIPGPLCQAACEMDGDLLLGAVGRANHAGRGASNTREIVGRDAAPRTSEVKPGADALDGNALYYGLEVKYDGGQPMTAKQYQSALRWAAAICDHFGWGAGSVIGHREHTRRKNDPGNCAMDKFRRDVDALLKTGPGGPTGNTPKPPSTDGLTVAEADRVIAYLAQQIKDGAFYGRYAQEIGEARDQNQKVLDALTTLTKAVNDLAAKLPKAP